MGIMEWRIPQESVETVSSGFRYTLFINNSTQKYCAAPSREQERSVRTTIQSAD